MALDARLAPRGGWRITVPAATDPEWTAARLTLELASGEVTVLLSGDEVTLLIARANTVVAKGR